MAVNPMQRRARNSFLMGFLIALIIMALVVLALVYQIKSIKEAKEKIEALQKSVYVAGDDLESGETITMDSFTMAKVQTTVDQSQVISEDDFEFYDDDGSVVIKYNDDGSERKKELVMKVNVPAGTIVTKDMVAEADNVTTSDQRIQEYNMILLPSQLDEGDYIDVRLSLPKGQDYIVLAKKKVLQTTTTGVWLKLSEEELLTINNAIVESYRIAGSKLYAIEYSDPGMQETAEITYPVSQEVLEVINSDPNIVETAKTALYNRYYANEQAQAVQRTNHINSALAENADSAGSNVESGNQEEIGKIQAAREEYIESLGE